MKPEFNPLAYSRRLNRVFWAPMTERGGNMVLDATGNYGALSFSGPTWVMDNEGAAINFVRASSQHITQTALLPTHSTQMWWAFTIFPASVASGANTGIIGQYKTVTDGRGWTIYHTNRTLRLLISGNGTSIEEETMTSFLAASPERTRVVVQFDSPNWSAIRTGQDLVVGTAFSTQTTIFHATASGGFAIGNRGAEMSDYFDGAISDVQIGHGVLTLDQMRQLLDDPWADLRQDEHLILYRPAAAEEPPEEPPPSAAIGPRLARIALAQSRLAAI